jgi:hypothetical protein
MQNDVKPVPGQATDKAIPQSGQRMIVPAEKELPREAHEPATGLQDSDARGGGRIFTQAFAADETRPQELHGAVEYQKRTADPGAKPVFWPYTDLTTPRNTTAID